MFFALKTTFVICFLSILGFYFLDVMLKSDDRKPIKSAIILTAGAFLSLCIGQPYLALGGLALVVAYSAQQKAMAAGSVIFLVATVPGIPIKIMIGSLQLIDISPDICVAFGAFVASLSWRNKAKVKASVADIPVYSIFAVLTFISVRDTSATDMLRVLTQNIALFIFPYLVIRKSLQNSDDIRNAFVLLVASGIAVSLIAIFESMMVWPMYQTYAYRIGTLASAGVKMRGGMLRAAGPSMNPPLSGAVLALCFVSIFAARDLFKTATFHRCVLILVIIGLFMMQTRVAWLGAVCGSVGVVISRRGFKAFVSYIPPVAIVLLAIYGIALSNERVANLVGMSSDAKGSSAYRDRLSDVGIEIVKAHPVIGQSISTVSQQMSSLRQGEGIIDFVNSYLAIALFSGLIGLGIFVGALMLQAYNVTSGRKGARARGGGSFVDMGLGVVVAAAAMFPYVPTDSRIILFMILLFALSNAVLRCQNFSNSNVALPARKKSNFNIDRN